jgi:hypothetical protein
MLTKCTEHGSHVVIIPKLCLSEPNAPVWVFRRTVYSTLSIHLVSLWLRRPLILFNRSDCIIWTNLGMILAYIIQNMAYIIQNISEFGHRLVSKVGWSHACFMYFLTKSIHLTTFSRLQITLWEHNRTQAPSSTLFEPHIHGTCVKKFWKKSHFNSTRNKWCSFLLACNLDKLI